jgi:hypothetical protein
MTPTLEPPALTAAPSGPMCRVLRRLLSGPLAAVRLDRRKVLCLLGGCEVDTRIVAGLLARGLIAERFAGDASSEYTLTPAGRGWAEFRPEADPEYPA